MKKLELLKIIKEDQFLPLNEFVDSGSDLNQTIYGKSLLTHAVLNKSEQAIFLFLMMGAKIDDLLKLKDWGSRLYELDPTFVQMIKEIENGEDRDYHSTVNTILRETNQHILGNKPLSHRNNLHFDDKNRYYKKIWAGLHLFEYRNTDFLSDDLFDIFQCDKNIDQNSKLVDYPKTKYATIVSVILKDAEMEKLPGISERIMSFLTLTEVPVEDLEAELSKIDEEVEYFIGVHFSDKSIFKYWSEQNWLDIDSKFFDSMKMVISRNYRDNDGAKNETVSKAEPEFYFSVFTFYNLTNWDQILNRQVQNFKSTYGHYPNLLLSSSATFSRIDLVANSRNKEKIKNSDGENPSDAQFADMTGFVGENYFLEFCIKENLPIDSACLIYDSDPDGGLPIDDLIDGEIRKVN